MYQLKIVMPNQLQPELLHFKRLEGAQRVFNKIYAARKNRTNEIFSETDDYENHIIFSSEAIVFASLADCALQFRAQSEMLMTKADEEKRANREYSTRPQVVMP